MGREGEREAAGSGRRRQREEREERDDGDFFSSSSGNDDDDGVLRESSASERSRMLELETFSSARLPTACQSWQKSSSKLDVEKRKQLERPERPERPEVPAIPTTPAAPEQTEEKFASVDADSLDVVEKRRTQGITPASELLYEVDPSMIDTDLERARELLKSEGKVSVTVVRLNKAGLVCKFSDLLEAFCPVAQLSSYTRQFYREEWVGIGESRPVGKKKVKSLVGENIDVCVIGVRDQEEESFAQKHKVVLSEKKAEEIGATEVFNVTEKGDAVECYVKTITHFGIFVKLGAIDALIHKSEVWLPQMEELGEDLMINEQLLSRNFSLGDRLQAVVEVVDKEKRKINLSMKALVPNRNKLSLS